MWPKYGKQPVWPSTKRHLIPSFSSNKARASRIVVIFELDPAYISCLEYDGEPCNLAPRKLSCLVNWGAHSISHRLTEGLQFHYF